MNFPTLPTPPRVDLPSQFVLPLEALATFWAAANIILGFIYLIFGLRVFRVMTTITAALWGAAIGIYFAHLIDSVLVAMIFGGAVLGTATWFYTRWAVAIPIGFAAAALAWTTAQVNGAQPLASFFISLAAAIAIGGPVVIYYRTVVMSLTCLQGAALVVIGSASSILLYQHKSITRLQDDLQPDRHLLMATVCVLLLAAPAFYFQFTRYTDVDENGSSAEDDRPAITTPRRKAA